ncbi:hypothetical protein ACXPWS_09410 [Mycobacterium sp. BMJ-28]
MKWQRRLCRLAAARQELRPPPFRRPLPRRCPVPLPAVSRVVLRALPEVLLQEALRERAREPRLRLRRWLLQLPELRVRVYRPSRWVARVSLRRRSLLRRSKPRRVFRPWVVAVLPVVPAVAEQPAVRALVVRALVVPVRVAKRRPPAVLVRVAVRVPVGPAAELVVKVPVLRVPAAERVEVPRVVVPAQEVRAVAVQAVQAAAHR